MICSKCGKEITSQNISFCPSCGAYITEENTSNNPKPEKESLQKFLTIEPATNTSKPVEFKRDEDEKKIPFTRFCLYVAVVACWAFAIFFLYNCKNNGYFFNDGSTPEQIGEIDAAVANYEAKSKSGQKAKDGGLGVTSIIYDNQYLKQTTLKNSSDVFKIVVTDSLKQKAKCPSNITAIENDIVNNYGIKAVNLCELDVKFAGELRDVTKYIYNNYPNSRNYLTNITLANVDGATFIAAFMPIFTFATSQTSSGYPVGIKTQIVLNAKYFLNVSKLENSVKYGTKSGYFPANATRSSTVAHEFGHYLSYVALLNHYKVNQLTYVDAGDSKMLMTVYNDFNDGDFSYQMLMEAYKDYTNEHGNSKSFDEFRRSISEYAMAKDSTGAYIYDETIAEAFHDCYLNTNNAAIESKFVVNALKKYL